MMQSNHVNDRKVTSIKKSPIATAHALAIVGGGLYIICALWTTLARGSFIALVNTWAHGINVHALPAKTLGPETLVVGFVTYVIAAWLTGYAYAGVYNRLVK